MLNEAQAPTVMETIDASSATPAASPTKTTCPYCGVGCGVLATPDRDGGAKTPEIPIIPRISAGCTPRVRRWAKRWRWMGGSCIR